MSKNKTREKWGEKEFRKRQRRFVWRRGEIVMLPPVVREDEQGR